MTAKPETPEALALRDDFTRGMGLFFGMWSSVDLATDYAIHKFLKITPEECHLITAGMMFGRKAKLLAGLISRSDHPKKSELLAAFNAIRGTSKRDVFAHSYIWSNSNSVRFLERSISGEFRAKEHPFTMQEFLDHLVQFANNSTKFHSALGASKEEIGAFAYAALSLSRKSKRSSGKPKAKA